MVWDQGVAGSNPVFPTIYELKTVETKSTVLIFNKMIYNAFGGNCFE